MLDTTTLFSVWYWALVVALWSEIVSYTYGVPSRLLQDAAAGDEEAADLVDRMARRFAAGAFAFWSRWAHAAVAAASAGTALLVTLALAARSELALGLIVALGPVCVMAGLALREALLVHRHQPDAQILLEVMIARRRANLAAAGLSIAIGVAALSILHHERLPFV